MYMFGGAKTPEGIIAKVVERIAELKGLDQAFLHNAVVQLYSGPNYKFFEENEDHSRKIIGLKTVNEERAKKQALEKCDLSKSQEEIDKEKATLINDTPIGKFLFEENHLYKWLKEEVFKDEKDETVKAASVDAVAKDVMTFVSALFIRSISGEVETAVCGAARDRVFYETEQKGLCDRSAFPKEAQVLVDELCANDDITKINGVDIGHFRKIHDRGDYEGVYRLICLAEIRDRLHLAQKTGDVDAFKDYLDRKELYEYDQIHLLTAISGRPVYQKHLRSEAERVAERNAKISEFEARHAASPTTPTPSGSRGSKFLVPGLC